MIKGLSSAGIGLYLRKTVPAICDASANNRRKPNASRIHNIVLDGSCNVVKRPPKEPDRVYPSG
jgi:hypothetical protein